MVGVESWVSVGGAPTLTDMGVEPVETISSLLPEFPSNLPAHLPLRTFTCLNHLDHNPWRNLPGIPNPILLCSARFSCSFFFSFSRRREKCEVGFREGFSSLCTLFRWVGREGGR